nr:putative nuclease HARBI1 [Leptinotarsa decemlineata]
MDLFEFIEDEFDEYLLNPVMRPRRRPVIRNRPNYFTELDETDFRARFRLSKPSVTYVLSLIEGNITTVTNFNFAISPMNRLLLTLRYYATGSFLITSGDFSGVSKASASRIISKVSRAIAELRPRFVKFPINLQSVKEGFYNIARFPRVIGTIDCTHVNIKSPGGEIAEYYRNRKGNFSINVQTVPRFDVCIEESKKTAPATEVLTVTIAGTRRYFVPSLRINR